VNSDTHALGHSKNHKDTPALPFCHVTLKAKKPKDSRYPSSITTIGDRLRAKRMDAGLEQKDIAIHLGVSEDSVCYWENGRVYPSPASFSKILSFLNDAKLPSMEK
jgi:DNA-binding transcriptional regulator YiaG